MEERIAGRLLCTVLGAEKLWPKSADGKANSYCSVVLDKSQPPEKTKEIAGNLSPQWSELLSFSVTRPFEVLEASVYHNYGEEAPGLDGFQGRCSVQLEDLGDQKPHEVTLELQAREPKDEVSGTLHLRLQYKYMKDWEVVYTSLEAVKEEKWDLALELLNKAIAIASNQQRLYQARSETFLRQQRIQEAMQDAQKMIEINPNTAMAHFQMGRVYEVAGELVPALESYKQGLGYNSKDEQLQEAVNRLQRGQGSSSKDPAIAEAAYLVGQHFNTRNYEEASVLITKLIANDPKSSSFHMARAECALGMKQTDFAQENALKAVALDSGWPKENATKSGWLKKEGALNKMKKRRWFVLKGHFLFYYNTNEDTMPNGVIPVHESCSVLRAARGGKKMMIKLPNRTFYIVAPNSKSGEEWLSALQAASHSPLEMPMIQGSSSNVAAVDGGRAARMSRRKQYGLSGTLIKGKLMSRRYHDVSVEGGLQDILREGFLYKTGNMITGGWKKRYFLLKKMHLYYFEEKPKEGTTALGEIPLEDCKWEKGQDDDFAHHVFNLVTPVRTYVLYAITKEEMLEWKTAIESASGGKPTPLASSLEALSHTNAAKPSLSVPSVTNGAQEADEKKKELEEQEKSASESAARKANTAEAEAAASDLELEDVTADSAPNVADFDFHARPRVAKNSMSASESRYFKKFGLQPPAQGRTESLHRIDSNPSNLTPFDPRVQATAEPAPFSSMRVLPRPSSLRVEEQLEATRSVQQYSDLRKAPSGQPRPSALDAMAGSVKYTAAGSAPHAQEETPLLGSGQSGNKRPLTEEEKRARMREMERSRRAQQQREDSCCVIS